MHSKFLAYGTLAGSGSEPAAHVHVEVAHATFARRLHVTCVHVRTSVFARQCTCTEPEPLVDVAPGRDNESMTHSSATLETTQRLFDLASNERQRITTKLDTDLRRIDRKLDADRDRIEQLIDRKISVALSDQKLARSKQTGRRLNTVLVFVVGVLAGVLLMALSGLPAS